MAVLRSIVSGLAAVVVGSVILVVCLAVILMVITSRRGTPVAVDLRAFARSPYAWVIALALFAAGFLVETWKSRS